VQAQTTEAPAPQPTAAESKAKEFAALARKEKSIVEQQRRWQQEKAQHEAELTELRGLKAKLEDARKNPLAGLGLLGTDYEKLSQHLLEEKDPVAQLKSEVEGLKAAREAEKRAQLQAEQQRLQQQEHEIVAGFHRDVVAFCEKNTEQYELIAALQAAPAVIRVITEHAQETGEVMDFAEAAKQIEAQLEERLTTKQKKWIRKPAEEQQPEAPQKPEAKPTQRQTTKTLSNALTASAATSGKTEKPMTDAELKAHLRAKFGQKRA
jgi:hypothetical protein